MQELGKLLRKLREKESLRDVSSRSGISHTYLGVIEKGIDQRTGNPIKPTPETLKTLAKAYNYSYEELMKMAGYLYESNETYTLDRTMENKQSSVVDLVKVLNEQPVVFKGRALSEADRKKVLDMLSLLLDVT
jgi:transcriptional regulator with XRE-family HTH domain